MSALEGKGLWVWYARQIVGVYGSVQAAVDAAVRGGFSHLLVKVANGWYPWLPGTYEGGYLLELIQAAHGAGMKVHAWRYTYAQNNVSSEVDGCRRAWDAYGEYCATWIEDAEREYKTSVGGPHADALLPKVKEIVGVPVGFTTYRYPDYHNSFPWVEFGEHCDFTLPQVYWIEAHNPGAQLRESTRQYAARAALNKFVPFAGAAGSTYRSGTWTPSAAEVDEFSETAKDIDIPAINWWRWDTLVQLGLWDTAAAQDWPVGDGPVRKHWSDLTAEERDAVLLRTAQAAEVADEDGFVVL